MGNVIEKWMAQFVAYWTEPRPAPKNLGDTEILDWLDEYCDQAVYNRRTTEVRGGFTIYLGDEKTTAPTLREAVCMAAAKWEQANS